MIIFLNPVFDVCIPDSFLYDVNSDLDKSLKIFYLSRALSIFRVRGIYFFHDKIINPNKKDLEMTITLLQYLDTPQYLRKKIYPKLDILKNVGKLHPIRSPHHKDKMSMKDIKNGETRVGLTEKKGNNYYVDVGLNFLINYRGNIKQPGKKVNVKLMRNKEFIFATDVGEEEIAELYWGYKVYYYKLLIDILKKFENSTILLTSRYSKQFACKDIQKQNRISNSVDNSILVVFGSPKFGLEQIFKIEKIDINNYPSFNFFPYQGTKTIRLEESIFGVLSVLNFCIFT